MADAVDTMDPAAIRQRLARADELEQRENERKGDYDAAVRRLEDRHTQAQQKAEARNAVLLKTIETTLSRQATTDAIRKVMPHATQADIDAISPHMSPNLRVFERAEQPGMFDVAVVDPLNPSRARASLRGKSHMTADELIEELRGHEAIGRLFWGDEKGKTTTQSAEFFRGNRMMKLTKEQAYDPKLYAQLVERKARGEIDGALDHLGRRLV